MPLFGCIDIHYFKEKLSAREIKWKSNEKNVPISSFLVHCKKIIFSLSLSFLFSLQWLDCILAKRRHQQWGRHFVHFHAEEHDHLIYIFLLSSLYQ